MDNNIYLLTKTNEKIPLSRYEDGQIILDPNNPLDTAYDYVKFQIHVVDKDVTSVIKTLFQNRQLENFAIVSPLLTKVYRGYADLNVVEESFYQGESMIIGSRLIPLSPSWHDVTFEMRRW